MIRTVEFGKLKAMLIDYVNVGSDGCYFLRFVGDEPTVNAIWARLSSREARGKPWESGVQIVTQSRNYPDYVALMKGTTYKTIRTRLSSGMVDVALIHPRLTLAEDDEHGFYCLTYADGMPTGFFDRLNHTLAIPLQEAWAPWLWSQGLQPLNTWMLETKTTHSGGQAQEQVILVEQSHIPITELDSKGGVRCFSVKTSGRYQDAWLEIIRTQLELGIPLVMTQHGYQADSWAILAEDGVHTLCRGDEVLVQAPSLNYALTWAKQELGLKFLVSSGVG